MSENKPLIRIRNADGSTMAIPAFQGPPGATFIPSVDKETGVISWTNNGVEGQFENPESVNILGPQAVYIGAEEPPVDSDYLIWVDKDQKEKEPIYFTPSVSEDGIISWTNNGGNGQYVNPTPVSIKGVKGDAGNGIDKIEQTTVSAEDDGKNVLTITVTDGTNYEFVVENGSSGTGIQSITLQGQDENGGNIYTVMLTDGTSYNITAPKGETGSGGGASNLLNGSADGSLRSINAATESDEYTMGSNAVALGYNSSASNFSSFAEGYITTASGENSHAEGYKAIASSMCSHAEGYTTIASGIHSHAEGSNTKASGATSHAEGQGTIAVSSEQHVQGRYNIEDENSKYAHIVGNGWESDGVVTRSNAHTLDWHGNAWYAGGIKVGGTSWDDGEEVALKSDLEDIGGGGSNILNADGIIKQEYLPNGYPYIGEYEEIISSTSFEIDGVDGADVKINSYFDIMEGLEYTVSINDTNYIVQAKIAVVDGLNVVYIGDGTFVGGEASDEPFVIVRLPDIIRLSTDNGYGLFLYWGTDSGSFTLSGPSFTKINSAYIPELYFPVTENNPGLMTPEDKIKLDGITGTNEVVVGTPTNISGIIKGNGSTVGVAIADTDYITPSFLGRNSALTEADTNYATAMARGIYFGTEDMIAGETELLSGVIYFVYE